MTMKKTIWPRLGSAIMSTLMIGMFSLAAGQIKPDSITISQPYSGGGDEDEFVVAAKTYIRLRVEILEIRPSETHPISSPSIRTENGKTAEILIGSQDDSLEIRITPTIAENRGIGLKVEFQKKPEMKDRRSAEALAQNGESAVMELFENKGGKSKIGLKITPLVEVVTPTADYPGPIRELRLQDSYLIKNDDRVIAHGDLSATNDQGEISLWFTDDEGLYVLGFKRFEGAEPKGFVRGTEIKVKFGEVVYSWVCRNPVLPEGKWLVWVLRSPGRSKSLSIRGGQGILGKNGMIGIGTGKDAWKRLIGNSEDGAAIGY
jgi:hypothetical protein